MKLKESRKDKERRRRLTNLWDNRVKSFYKMAVRMISSKTLTLIEAKKLVHLYSLFANQYIYFPEKMKAERKELKDLIKKIYY